MISRSRDFLLSFCPAAMRRAIPPESPVRTLQAATWGGLAQFFMAAFVLLVRFKSYFVLRVHQLSPHVAGTTEVIEAGLVAFITVEYLLHPFSLLLLYLSIEGLLRFAGGLIAGQVLPSGLVFLGFKIVEATRGRRRRREIAALPPDAIERLSDGRVRISCARSKERWNASITISIHGEWYEVERSEAGAPPRPFVYVLRPAPQGKILRGYEEYDLASAVSIQPRQAAREGAPDLSEKV